MAVAQRFTITTIRGQASGRRTAYGAWGTAAGLASEAAEVSWAKMSPRDYLFGAVGSKPQQRRRTRLHMTDAVPTRRSSASQANATSDPRGCHSRWLILSLVQTVAAPPALPARGPGSRFRPSDRAGPVRRDRRWITDRRPHYEGAARRGRVDTVL